MTDAANATEKCEFCDKRGLPLLLVRDALVPVGAGAPVSSDRPFKVPEDVAYYTRRVLRNGFVNVFDEARKRWEAYYVTRDGYYFKMPVTPGVIPIKPNKPFNCSDLGHRAVASCITVSDPKKATKVWIGFSDAIWTNKVRERNENPAYRQKHMVSIDVAAVLAGRQQAHCRPISQVPAVVAEYAMAGLKNILSMNWNSFQFSSREGGAAARLLAECEVLRPGKGQIVTVPDPAGVVSELAMIMTRNSEFYNRHPNRSRQLKVDIAMTGIESSIRDNAMLKAYEDAQKSTRMYDRMGSVSESVAQSYAKLKDAAVDLSDAQRKKAADDAWEKYEDKINTKERGAWQTSYTENLAIYSKKWVDPLAVAHVEVMKSPRLADYFETNFDETNVDSGEVYVKTVSMCVMATQDKPACAKLYSEWINGVFNDHKNFLLRSLILNQEKLGKKIDETVKETVNPLAIPWDNLIGMYGEFIKGPPANIVSKALVLFGGAIAHVLSKWIVDGALIRGSILVLGMIAKRSLVRIELTDKRVEFRKLVAKQLITRSGLAIDPRKLSAAISAELTLQGVTGEIKRHNVRATWIIFVDKVIPGLDPGATEEEKIAHVLRSIRSVATVERTEQFSKVRAMLNSDVKAGTLALIIQCVCFSKLLDDEAKALPAGKLETRWKLTAGFLGIAGTATELITNAYKGSQVLKLGTAFDPTYTDNIIRGAKVVGIFGAFIVACFDVNETVKALRERDRKMGLLYGSSALGGVMLAVCMSFPSLLGFMGVFAIPFLGLLFLAVIGIAVAIEYFKDNPIEDWLERTIWGTFTLERYPNESVEQAAYNKIIPKE